MEITKRLKGWYLECFFHENQELNNWNHQLIQFLGQHKEQLPVNLSVVVSKKSSSYIEIPLLCAFISLGLASFAAIFVQAPLLPLTSYMLGFTLGLLLQKNFLKHPYFQKTVKQRVGEKAKHHFFESIKNLNSSLLFVYYSYMENELFITSNESELLDALNLEKLNHLQLNLKMNPKVAYPDFESTLGELIQHICPAQDLEDLTPLKTDKSETNVILRGHPEKGNFEVYIVKNDGEVN